MESAKKIDAAAADWFAKRDRGNWREQDQLAFDAWLNSNLAHRLAYIRVATVWKQAQRLKALRGNTQQEVPPAGGWQFSPVLETTARSRTRMALPTWIKAVAATIAFAACAGYAWYAISNRVPAYRTAIGTMETVPLQDGSTVILNTNSAMQVALTASARTITLEGEAFFDVAKDPVRPFVVEVGDERIIAVGTQFSVRRDGATVRVAVTEGRVRLETRSSPGQTPIRLEPGDVASAGRDGVLVRQKPVAQLEAEDLGWRRGYMSFHDTALGDVVAELNRYNVRKIRIANPALAAIRVGGEFRVTDVDAFLRLVQPTLPVHVVNHGDEILLQDSN